MRVVLLVQAAALFFGVGGAVHAKDLGLGIILFVLTNIAGLIPATVITVLRRVRRYHLRVAAVENQRVQVFVNQYGVKPKVPVAMGQARVYSL